MTMIIDDVHAAARATRRCRSLAIELNNAGVALMIAERCDDSDSGNAAASSVLSEAIRMMQMCLRRRRDLTDGINQCANAVDNAEETLSVARRRLDATHAEEEAGGSSSSYDAPTCCGPIELADQDEAAGEEYGEVSSLQTLREDCAVMMHNLALSHQSDGSSSASQFKALSYFEMALLLLQDGSRDSSAALSRRNSSSCGGSGARGTGSASRRHEGPDRAALSQRLVLSSISHSVRIHGGLGNHTAAEEYGNELSRLLMMMSEEELMRLGNSSDDNAAAAA